MNNKVSESGLSIERVETLVDGIFAIAMTLLVLNLSVPAFSEAEAVQKLPKILLADLNKLFCYCLSFLLLGNFWITHHRMSVRIKKASMPYVWINIFLLMFIALVPFTTSLASDYSSLRITNWIFQGNLLIISLIFSSMWQHAAKERQLLKESVSDEVIELAKRRRWVMPGLSVTAMLVAFVAPDWSSMVYVSAPFLMGLVEKKCRD